VVEPDPHDLLRPFDPEVMTMWPVSTRVNSRRKDDPSFVEAVDLTDGLVL
jgi:putative SOS response-associated peptidase YedK